MYLNIYVLELEHLCTSFCADIHFYFSWMNISSSGIWGPYDNFMFTLLMNYQPIFQSGCKILCSQQCMRIPVSHIIANICQCLFLIITILVSLKSYFTVVFICISIMANNVQNRFKCFLANCISSFVYFSLENVCSDPLHILKFGLSFYCCIIIVFNVIQIQVLYQLYDLKIFAIILWVVFLLLQWCSLKHKSF